LNGERLTPRTTNDRYASGSFPCTRRAPSSSSKGAKTAAPVPVNLGVA